MMLSSSKTEEVSQDSFAFRLAERQIDRLDRLDRLGRLDRLDKKDR